MKKLPMTRRDMLNGLACSPFLIPIHEIEALAQKKMSMSKIPKTGEQLGKVGVGTYRTFDVSLNDGMSKRLLDVLQALFAAGGTCIDSSPMYGKAEEVVGQLTKAGGWNNKAFMATKVWTQGKKAGKDQIESSMKLLKRNMVDLYQVHNLVDINTQLATLRELKKAKKVRYIGITHYTTSAFPEVIQVMKKEELDFVQIPYSIVSRQAEKTLLPLAKDKGIAVIPNQSFEQGELFRKTKGKKLPSYVRDYQISSWAQLFLKYVLSHSSVTTVIPGTSRLKHMLDNIQAGHGRYFSSAMQARIAKDFMGSF